MMDRRCDGTGRRETRPGIMSPLLLRRPGQDGKALVARASRGLETINSDKWDNGVKGCIGAVRGGRGHGIGRGRDPPKG